METLAAAVSSLPDSELLHSVADALVSAGGDGRPLRLLRLSLMLSLHLFLSLLSLFSLLLSHLSSPPRRPSPRASAPDPLSPTDGTSAGRALSRVLSAVSRVPVASRKYDLVRSLAERLLGDNLRYASSEGRAFQVINRAAVSAAFARTLSRLEAAVATEASLAPGDGSGGRIMGAVKSRVRRWAEGAAVAPGTVVRVGVSADKLAAEVMWLGQKMAESGAVADAVAMWGEAAGLAQFAVSAVPRLRNRSKPAYFSFMFKHANSKNFDEVKVREEEESHLAIFQMAMLRSWLPLLCQACNGVDTPILSCRVRAEMVSMLEEMIEKLSWDQQEEVLSLWLHHFTECPDSDWPNLESCYMRWYSESLRVL
ncbi:hypothetical protein MUK42_13783 [Musa troglodytarum]|uniref:Uncharacterized protein n=1 Tax=Musa troglodytarum TaxID=320322 RepID=A0A9E7L3X9_9LILI|nr:hypothetical protein MUK42_13783 [Musa troglodytarum]